MKNLPIGKYEFRHFKEENYIYVDKTKPLINLARLSIGVFSALNSLSDISLNHRYATLTGYTQKEIKEAFPQHIEEVKNKLGLCS